MATLLPTGYPSPGGDNHKVIVGGRFDYNSASGTYALAHCPPNTFVEDVTFFIATAWSGGGAACLGVGDSLATRGYFAQVTVGTAGAYKSMYGAQANARGTHYPAARDIVAYYTQDSSDTQGAALYYATLVLVPSLNVGGIVEAF